MPEGAPCFFRMVPSDALWGHLYNLRGVGIGGGNAVNLVDAKH
jgi:hypothetical protein